MKSLRQEFVKLQQDSRLYHLDKPIIALTGGIATGKSTVTKRLEAKGIKIIDADALVKNIYSRQESQDFIRQNFPDVWKDDSIDFKVLREIFFKNPKVKEQVEGFIYSRLPQAFKKAAMEIQNQNFYVYDVPLLFERNLDTKVDLKIVVYAPRKVQMARLVERDGTKEEIRNKILMGQMDIEEKRLKADFVIDNSGSMTELAAEVDSLLQQILIT